MGTWALKRLSSENTMAYCDPAIQAEYVRLSVVIENLGKALETEPNLMDRLYYKKACAYRKLLFMEHPEIDNLWFL